MAVVSTEKILKRYWREINKPDNNLGRYTIGPSPQKITFASAQRVLTAMNLRASIEDPKSGKKEGTAFLDIGSNLGQVPLMAHLLFDIPTTVGWEIDETAISTANRLLSAYRPTVSTVECDVTKKKVFEGIQYVYAFDKDFLPAIVEHIIQMLEDSPSVLVFANSKPLRCLNQDKLGWFVRNFSLTTTITVSLSGSGQKHSIRVWHRNIIDNTEKTFR